MIYAILAITVITTAGSGYFAWLAYKERREMQARHDLVVAGLLQRIQAPETAVAQHVAAEQPPLTPHVPIHDDAAYFEALESSGLLSVAE